MTVRCVLCGKPANLNRMYCAECDRVNFPDAEPHRWVCLLVTATVVSVAAVWFLYGMRHSACDDKDNALRSELALLDRCKADDHCVPTMDDFRRIAKLERERCTDLERDPNSSVR